MPKQPTGDKTKPLLQQLELLADCTAKCRSAAHAGELVCAATHSCPENEIIAWISRHCYAPARTRDENGRSLLHIAASLGKIKILEWLLKFKDGTINTKDGESGYTALHRAIFFGQIQTVTYLIKQGANLALTDNNGLTALDHALMDRPPHVSYSIQSPLEAYVWGSNSNYNLGTGDYSTRTHPDIIEQLRKQGSSIKKVSLQKFHSGFLTSSGSVFTCGHGRGGRLGIGSETMLLTPAAIQIGSCIDLALGVDHSLFLTESGTVFTCGENTFHQLGHQPPPPRLLAPAPIGGRGGIKLPVGVGVAAARYHSVFWTDDAVYTWGLNAGQLGHIKGDKTIILPKMVTSFAGNDTKIDQVCVSDGATVVCTSKGDVLALYEYTTKKIGLRQQNILKIQVVGGHLDPAVDPGGSADIDFKLVAGGGVNLRVFILTKAGRILVWEEGKEKKFLSCVLALSRSPPLITDFAPYREGMLLVSKEGEAWSTTWPQPIKSKRAPSPTVKVSKESIVLKLKRIPHVHRAVRAVSDPKGRNFCILQVSPRMALTEIPEISPSTQMSELENLLSEVDELDGIHDTVCVVGDQRFPAHSFILASGAELLSKQLRFAETLHPTVLQIEDIEPDIFRQVLKYLYTKTCDLLKEGPCPVRLVEEDYNNMNEKNTEMLDYQGNPETISAFSTYEKNRKKNKNRKAEQEESNKKKKSWNPLVQFQEAGRSLGIYGLNKIVDCFRFSEGQIFKKSNPPRPRQEFSMKNLSELYDVTIETEDGDEIYAHKPILVSRSDYFQGMFSSGWMEGGESHNLKLPIKTRYIECVVEYLYRDESKILNKSEDTEFISNILVVADQFLIVRLKEICENQLSKLITLKNVSDMLEFSLIYQANQLKLTCLQFVCINLPALLENKGLENLEPEVLSSLDKYYQDSNPSIAHRRITPMSGFPSREDIETEYLTNPLSLEDLERMETCPQVSSKTRPRRNSSGDKIKSPNPRQRLSESSLCSGSDSEDGNISQDMDRLSVLDFDIEEKDEISSPECKLSPEIKVSQGKESTVSRDSSFFSALLTTQPNNQTTSTDQEKADSPEEKNKTNKEKIKKFPKLSQKERKRQSVESQETPEVESPSSGKLWGGWGAAASSPLVPSLTAIMQIQGKNGTKERKVSESETKPEIVVKKGSWKQLGWELEKEKSPTKPAPNPWNLSVVKSPDKPDEIKFSDLMATEQNLSFSKIMEDHVKEEKTLIKVQSKPLHLTQLEEKAMDELKKIYELQHPGDCIVVSRVELGKSAPPVWKKIKS